MSSPGRRYAGVLVMLLVSSVGILVSYGATWAVAVVPVFAGEGESPGREVVLAGRDLAPLGGAMGWVGLAAVAALLATRTWGRRVTGAAVLLAGGVAGVTGITFALTEVATGGGGAFIAAALGTQASTTSVSVSAWWIVAVVSGLAVLACGFLALLDGPNWPRLGERYSRPDTHSGQRSAASTWDALDRGEDPTLADEPGDPRGSRPGSMEAQDSLGPESRSEEER